MGDEFGDQHSPGTIKIKTRRRKHMNQTTHAAATQTALAPGDLEVALMFEELNAENKEKFIHYVEVLIASQYNL